MKHWIIAGLAAYGVVRLIFTLLGWGFPFASCTTLDNGKSYCVIAVQVYDR